MEFNCRHCGRVSKPTGFWRHLRTHREALTYEEELKAHGVNVHKGTWTHIGKPVPTTELVRIMNPPDGERLTITREALALALSGLERVKGELEGHIADVRATLNPPLQRKAYKKQVKLPEAIPRPAAKTEEITARWIRNAQGVTKKYWSNDPEGRYRHNQITGEILINPVTGRPDEKSKSSPASIAAMAKARAALRLKRKRGIK